MSNRFLNLFKTRIPVIGMIHVDALPGTPGYAGDMAAIIDHARTEAKIYLDAGVDAVAVENMHDVPYLKRVVGAEVVTAMTVVGYEVKQITGLPVGIQILAGANTAALAAGQAAGLDFIRAEGFVYGHLADEGLLESDAGELLRYRRQIGAENIAVLTDIKKKHSSHAITQDVDILAMAQAAEFFLSDGVIITGQTTGEPADPDEIKRVKSGVDGPVLVGSGVTLNNLADYITYCDGLIIGSWFKREGCWENTVDPERVSTFMSRILQIRGT